MPLSPGDQLGPYSLISLLGEGGMGEVWKARDIRLDRTVALKVSKDQFTERFQREARSVAALNHPNICTLHDVGPNYLVMELIDGEPLSGPMPVDKVIEYSGQILDALDAAHHKGITHRDLKPANILITKRGIKLLDFGLAKQSGPLKESDATIQAGLTHEGQILGTLQYMSPEQLQGRVADARSDIFSFGLVLYEMLTGKRAFNGSSTASVIAAILEREAPSIAGIAPVALECIFRRCLAKDPDNRWQTVRDLKAAIEWVGEAPAPGAQATAASASGRTSRRQLLYALVATAMIAVASAGFAAFHFRKAPADARTVRFSISPPENMVFTNSLAISPDGLRLVFGVAATDGKNQLWVRSLDALTAEPLAGTDGASNPFWSPDSRFLGFFAGGKLKRIDPSGGPALTLCDAPDAEGGTWNREGVIVFSPKRVRLGPLDRVSAAGGVSSPITSIDQARLESIHRWPWFLPDGKHFLYLAGGGAIGVEIRMASLDSSSVDSKFLIQSRFNAAYASGYLLFLRQSTLMAQPFDLKHLAASADAVPVAELVQTLSSLGRGVFSVSANGILVYRTGSPPTGAQLAWFDRGGKRIATIGDKGLFGTVHLSPGGNEITVSMGEEKTSHRDVWRYDVTSGLRTRFTFDAAEARESTWSPDGRMIVFNSNRSGHFDLYEKPSSGAGSEKLLYADGLEKYPSSFSPDGKFLLYWSQGAAKTKNIIWVLPLTGERKPFRLLNTASNESWGQFSPDGRWIAYRSDESQRDEIYVTPFPGSGGKRQISTGGGDQPLWRRDGKEIFYLGLEYNQVMSAEWNTNGDAVEVGVVRPLFGPVSCGSGYCYRASADGQRFLVRTDPDQTSSAPLTVVQNWTADLKK